MRKYRKIMVVGSVVLVLSLIIGGVYFNRSNKQQVSAQAEESLEVGISLFNQEKYAEALNALESIPAGAPGEWWARYYQGSAYIMLKEYDAAITYLDQALALAPSELRIMHALGVAHFKSGHFGLARAYYAAVLEIDPEDEEARGLMNIMAQFEERQLQRADSGEDHESQAANRD
jgi:Flp pilus assembly protein TadD